MVLWKKKWFWWMIAASISGVACVGVCVKFASITYDERVDALLVVVILLCLFLIVLSWKWIKRFFLMLCNVAKKVLHVKKVSWSRIKAVLKALPSVIFAGFLCWCLWYCVLSKTGETTLEVLTGVILTLALLTLGVFIVLWLRIDEETRSFFSVVWKFCIYISASESFMV
jgi:hypothetical protein